MGNGLVMKTLQHFHILKKKKKHQSSKKVSNTKTEQQNQKRSHIYAQNQVSSHNDISLACSLPRNSSGPYIRPNLVKIYDWTVLDCQSPTAEKNNTQSGL